MSYGYTIEAHKRDPLVHIANLALEHFAIAGTPGTWLVDMIPACKYYLFLYCFPTIRVKFDADHRSETRTSLPPWGWVQAHRSSLEE